MLEFTHVCEDRYNLSICSDYMPYNKVLTPFGCSRYVRSE
jgi:hypothetical protein